MTTKSSEKGPPRKSRRRRLPIASAGRYKEFLFTDSDWERLRCAYPCLVEDDRAPIAKIVDRYLEREIFERTAPFFDDAMSWLNQVRASALTFEKVSSHSTKPESAAAIAFARSLVSRHLQHAALENDLESRWDTATSVVAAIACAVDDTIEQLNAEADSGFVEGRRWNHMIGALAEYAESRAYRVSASKGVDKTAAPKTSPFVAFVREIQITLPRECRRHTASDVALAEGITLARRENKKRQIVRRPNKLVSTVHNISRSAASDRTQATENKAEQRTLETKIPAGDG